MCGAISQYNAESKSGPTVSIRGVILRWYEQIQLTAWPQRNFFNVITQRIK
jgi:hypothetical protein